MADDQLPVQLALPREARHYGGPDIGRWGVAQSAVVAPFGGSVQWRYRHGFSDPIPHDAGADAFDQAIMQAFDRDQITTAAHDADRAAYYDCAVCFPVARMTEAAYEPRFRELREWIEDVRFWWVEERPGLPYSHLWPGWHRILWGVTP